MNNEQYDVIIIGAGVTGCAIARELSRYDMNIAVLEKEEDVCSGTSKANSGIVHAGYDAETGSLKARFNLEGNRKMGELAEELGFDFKRDGSIVLCFHKEDLERLQELYERGVKNGVPDLKILNPEEIKQMEPHITDEVVAALYAPTGGIVCPFGLTIALAENACTNGVTFLFNHTVKAIQKLDQGYKIETNEGEINTHYIINAAGVHADEFHNMVSEKKMTIIPRRGEYCLLDKEAGGYVSHTIFQLPGKYGKGILVTPTVHGNLLVGPTANDLEEKEDTSTTAEGLEEVITKASRSVKKIPFDTVITSFSGIRAHEESGDFIIGEVEDAKGFYDVAGIESPGLSCAPAIGEYVANLVAADANARKKEHYQAHRDGFLRPEHLSKEERVSLIRQKPEYGHIICRCENVSEGEILEAIHRNPGAVSMDGIKRRVRQGMGRCQGGFCTPKVMEILAKEQKVSMESICKNREGSNLLEQSH